MSEDDLDKLDPDAVDDTMSLRGLVRQLLTLIGTLQALIAELRSDAAKRDEKLAEKDAEISELKTALLGPKTERGSRSDREPKPPVPEAVKKAKRKRARGKAKTTRKARNEQLDTERVLHPADDSCPCCGSGGPFISMRPEVSTEIEYLSERLTRLLHVIEKKLCPCGHIFSGETPERVVEGGHYGPGVYAHAVVSKCADALPLNRVAKRFRRAGLHIARSTLTDLYHRSAELLAPIYRRLVALVSGSFYINADETSQPVMDKDHCRRGFIWTFIAGGVIAYVFSANRSGETPRRLLQGTVGALQVDGYTGYNDVCVPEGRTRYGCLSHARRYFHKARDHCPDEVDHSIRVILKLYQVEYDAAAKNILGTNAHRLLRKHRSRPIMDEWKLWLTERKDTHAPKSPMGRAIRYTLNQWEYLTRYIADPKVRLDNNISEGALRIIALGRDNFRWVGHDQAGENLAILQTIVATCVASDVNPQDYIADVLMRVGHHPASLIDELLPMNWVLGAQAQAA